MVVAVSDAVQVPLYPSDVVALVVDGGAERSLRNRRVIRQVACRARPRPAMSWLSSFERRGFVYSVASAVSGRGCPFDDAEQAGVGGVAVPLGDVAADMLFCSRRVAWSVPLRANSRNAVNWHSRRFTTRSSWACRRSRRCWPHLSSGTTRPPMPVPARAGSSIRGS